MFPTPASAFKVFKAALNPSATAVPQGAGLLNGQIGGDEPGVGIAFGPLAEQGANQLGGRGLETDTTAGSQRTVVSHEVA